MKKTLQTSVIALLLLAIFNNEAQAQQRFRAGMVGGLNAAQILGDDSAGYNKLGLCGGLRVITVLQDKMDIIIEMLYSQRGSYEQFILGDMKINLKYIEIPVLFAYKDWYQKEDDFYKVQAVGGLSYGRLLKATAIGSLHDEEVENFNDNDISVTFGADFFMNKHFGFGARWTRSLNRLYNHSKHEEGLDSLVGYFLSFRTMYIF
ncbi:MAG: PorT family protein [Saprospiraceae bacterium]|nr:PorT family protein [Saprospiraceae bacterium]